MILNASGVAMEKRGKKGTLLNENMSILAWKACSKFDRVM